MKQINSTSEHAHGNREDDKKKGHFCYWVGRETGKAPRGRGVGTKKGEDFGGKGETMRLDPTVIKRRLDAVEEELNEENGNLTEMVEAKDGVIKKLRAENAQLKIENEQHSQHGNLYEVKAQGILKQASGFYLMMCRTHKIEPMEIEELLSFEKSFEEYASTQKGRKRASQSLKMDEEEDEEEDSEEEDEEEDSEEEDEEEDERAPRA